MLHAWVGQDCSLLLTRYIPRPCSRLLHVTPRPHNPTSLAKHERAAAAPTTVMLSLALLTADLPARAVVTCGYRDRTAVCCVSVMEFNRKNISHVLVAIVRARQGTMWLCALGARRRRFGCADCGRLISGTAWSHENGAIPTHSRQCRDCVGVLWSMWLPAVPEISGPQVARE